MCLPPPWRAVEGRERVLELLSAERDAGVTTAESRDESNPQNGLLLRIAGNGSYGVQMPHLVMGELAYGSAQASNSRNDSEQTFT
jgi:hypothetical protein